MILAKVITIEKPRWQKVRVVKIGNKKTKFLLFEDNIILYPKTSRNTLQEANCKIIFKNSRNSASCMVKKIITHKNQ